MDWHLPDEEATTVAGLVIHEARSIPERGQSFTFHGFRYVELNGLPTAPPASAITGVVMGTDGQKVSRFITHNKKLKDCEDSVALVFGRMEPLGEKAGPALIQLPPQLRRNDERLAGFLKLLPKGRHTVEFRHPSWYEKPVFDLLSDHNVALCISDHHDAPSPWEVTASFVYVRGHGPGGRYHRRYPGSSKSLSSLLEV